MSEEPAPKPRTHEEIAKEWIRNEVDEPVDLLPGKVASLAAALREAADVARADEREALREGLRRLVEAHESCCDPPARSVLHWLDSRKDPA